MKADLIEYARNQVQNAAGSGDEVKLTAEDLKALLDTITDQEIELMGLDKAYSNVKGKILRIASNLSCYSFEEMVPAKEDNNEIFEVFVGEVSDCGRIFAFWDESEQSFFNPPLTSSPREYLENVVYWRYGLPEPHEAYDIGDL